MIRNQSEVRSPKKVPRVPRVTRVLRVLGERTMSGVEGRFAKSAPASLNSDLSLGCHSVVIRLSLIVLQLNDH